MNYTTKVCEIFQDLNVLITHKLIDDPISECIKSGTVNYMRREMIPVLDGAGKEWIFECYTVGLVSVVFKVVAASS